MKLTTKMNTIGVVLALGITGTVAAESGTNMGSKKAAETPQTRGMQAAVTARELARYGHRNDDALALIAAARMMKQNPVSESDELESHATTGGDSKQDALVLEPGPVLERAREVAGDREDLVALADEVDSLSSRGLAGGPNGTVTRVRAEATDIFPGLVFEGDEPAQVGIQGDGDTDLDLYVYDENGNLICAGESYSDVEICEWTPAWTGEFEIEVKNYGDVWNEYMIMTN